MFLTVDLLLNVQLKAKQKRIHHKKLLILV